MVAETASGPAQAEEARQASVQELQSLRDSLNQAEVKTRDQEAQLENLTKVKHWTFNAKFLIVSFFYTYERCVLCKRTPVNSNVIGQFLVHKYLH